MNLPSYPKYKPSGVEWIGDVPEHWEVRRLRTTTENVIDQTNQKADWEIYIALEHVESWTGRIHEYDSGVVFESQVKKFRFNDVLFGKLRPYLAKIARPSTNGVCVGEFLVLRPRNGELTPNYLEYLLRSKPMIDLISASTFGAKMPRTDWQFIGELLHPLPPLSEQIYVSDFLDRKTEKIEMLIDKNQILIERLKEKRTALITRTVTCGPPPDTARAAGLDPYPKLKPSGVDWIGDVPEHWDIFPLKRCYRVINGGTPSSTEEAYWDGNINWITPDDLGKNRSKHIEDSRRTISTEGLINCGAQLVPTNSIVLSTRAPIGHVAVIGKESCTNQGCRALVPDERHAFSDYLYYTLVSSRSVLIAAGKGTTFMELSADHLGSHVAPFPPFSEQRAIADFLDRETEKIDDMIANIETSIDRLREYRSAIIDAAVTGKIDARIVDTQENVPPRSRSQ